MCLPICILLRMNRPLLGCCSCVFRLFINIYTHICRVTTSHTKTHTHFWRTLQHKGDQRTAASQFYTKGHRHTQLPKTHHITSLATETTRLHTHMPDVRSARLLKSHTHPLLSSAQHCGRTHPLTLLQIEQHTVLPSVKKITHLITLKTHTHNCSYMSCPMGELTISLSLCVCVSVFLASSLWL